MRPTVKMLLERIEGQEKRIQALEAEFTEMKRFIPDYWRKQGKLAQGPPG